MKKINKNLQFSKYFFDETIKVKKLNMLDQRGSFQRVFCKKEFRDFKLNNEINQINISKTTLKGSVRGLHFQKKPYAEVKIISCLKGKIWDVMVDIREESSTYLKWNAIILSPENNTSIYIPEGFAHGFQTLTKDVELLYLHSKPYMPSHEFGLNPLDPKVDIEWPIKISNISYKDKNRTHLK